LVGNLAAIMQTNIKRMLAYSTVSHMGFILLAFMAGAVGFAAGLYYAITYALMAAAGFGVLMVLSDGDNECENISDLAGLNQHRVWLAFLMLLVMFSMAGIPPLMGFYAKFGVIMALLKQGYVWLSVFAVVMSLIGAFYYLRVVKVMYFDESGRAHPTVGGNNAAKFLLSVNALLLVLWGIMPQTVIDWCAKALENTL
ncbi:NADH:ubiquinone oxidoreductase subunit N, partial [Neisseria meningitidis]